LKSSHPTVRAALARPRPLGIDEHLHRHFQIPKIPKNSTWPKAKSINNNPTPPPAPRSQPESNPKEPTLWILASQLEKADGKSIKARALLDKARQANPGNDLLWAKAARAEERSGAKSVQAKAFTRLQECSSSGLLWSMALWAELRVLRKMKRMDALRKTRDSPLVVCTIARVLWTHRMIERARD